MSAMHFLFIVQLQHNGNDSLWWRLEREHSSEMESVGEQDLLADSRLGLFCRADWAFGECKCIMVLVHTMLHIVLSYWQEVGYFWVRVGELSDTATGFGLEQHSNQTDQSSGIRRAD